MENVPREIVRWRWRRRNGLAGKNVGNCPAGILMKRRSISVLVAIALVMLMLGPSSAWSQDNSTQEPATPPDSGQAQQPAPAFGPDSAVPMIEENPPISGLDLPNLQPHAAPLSYLQAGAHVSESLDSNIENTLGGSEVQSLTRATGSLELHRLWSNYDLSLDYLGGIGYYDVQGLGLKQIEELGLEQKITWKRGELAIRDAFSYQPEGTFGSAYGSVGTIGAGLSGDSTFFGGTGLGALGQVPRIMNLSLVDIVQNLTPKSSITLTGGYGFVHFLEDQPGTGISFIGNSQVSAEAGYSRVLSRHDQAAIVYGYQGFRFSTGISFHSRLMQLMWGRRISGRMAFLVGAGPQFTELNSVAAEETGATSDLRISAAGRALLHYQFPRTSLGLSYDHYITSGSGFFAGAESDIARLTASRPMGRVWTVFSDIGYSRNSRVEAVVLTAGVNAKTYQYGFAGAGVHRMFGRNFHAFASYQFNDLAFDSSFCGTSSQCNRTSQRNVGTIGLDWTPRPHRLD